MLFWFNVGVRFWEGMKKCRNDRLKDWLYEEVNKWEKEWKMIMKGWLSKIFFIKNCRDVKIFIFWVFFFVVLFLNRFLVRMRVWFKVGLFLLEGIELIIFLSFLGLVYRFWKWIFMEVFLLKIISLYLILLLKNFCVILFIMFRINLKLLFVGEVLIVKIRFSFGILGVIKKLI